jgi:hypothetical protein
VTDRTEGRGESKEISPWEFDSFSRAFVSYAFRILPLRRHADTPTRRYADTPKRRHADTPIRRYVVSVHFSLLTRKNDGQNSQPMSESLFGEAIRALLKVTPLWMVLLSLPFIERTLLGAKTFYLLYVGLALVFVTYGLTIRWC